MTVHRFIVVVDFNDPNGYGRQTSEARLRTNLKAIHAKTAQWSILSAHDHVTTTPYRLETPE